MDLIGKAKGHFEIFQLSQIRLTAHFQILIKNILLGQLGSKTTLWRYWFIILLIFVPASGESSTDTEMGFQLSPENADAFLESQSETISSLKSVEKSVQSVPKPIWQRIFEEVSEISYYDFLYELSVTIGPRPYGTTGNDQAITWLNSTMESISGDAATVEVWGEYNSVVGILDGYDPSLMDVIVIGAHMDTVSGVSGADDDGSGTALVLEALRVLSQYRVPRDIYFCAFNAEEIGLFGSQDVARILREAGTQVQMMFNADMILWDPEGSGSREYIYYESTTEQKAAEIAANMSREYGDDVFLLDSSGGGGNSDHASFRQQGYGAVYAAEAIFNPYLHQAADTIFHPECNFTLAAEVTASFAATAAQLAFEGISPTIDFDNDGLTDVIELEIGTEITDPDTDHDGLLDGEEVNHYQTDPLERDTDNDRLIDGDEILTYHTDPLDPDSDADGIIDGEEVIWWGTDPSIVDTDADGLTDYAEIIEHNTNPLKIDTDSDGLPDGQEIQWGTNPKLRDSDGDLIPDGEEVERGWNPLDPTNPGDTTSSKKSSDTGGFVWSTLMMTLLVIVIVQHKRQGS